jgi:hypothetical protein
LDAGTSLDQEKNTCHYINAFVFYHEIRWNLTSFCGVCHTDAAGVLGGPGPAAVLRLISRGLGQAGSKRLLWERMRALFYDYAL